MALPTAPAPGTGYDDSGAWWKEPLGDLLEGAGTELRERLGIDDDSSSVPSSSIDAAATSSPGFRIGGLSMTELLLWGGFIFGGLQLALNYAAVRPKRRRR